VLPVSRSHNGAISAAAMLISLSHAS